MMTLSGNYQIELSNQKQLNWMVKSFLKRKTRILLNIFEFI